MGHRDAEVSGLEEKESGDALTALIKEPLTRAQLLQRAAVGGAALSMGPLLAACGGSGGGSSTSAKPASMTFTSWGGTTQAAQQTAWTKPWGKSEGIVINQGGPTDYGRIKAQVEAKKVSWSVVDVEGDFAVSAGAQGLLEPIDYSKVPQSGDIFPEFKSKYGVGDLIASIVIAYDPKKTGGHGPTTWAEFFDTQKFPGKRSMYKYFGSQQGVLEAALLADGVSPANLYPLDYNRAINKLDTIKKDIVWWSTGADSQEFITDGTVSYIAAWNGRMYDLMTKGVPVTMEWDQNLLVADYLVVPKGAPSVSSAMELIGYATSPGPQAKFAELTSYAPVNKQAVDKVDPKVRPYMSTAPENKAKGLVVDIDWWAKNKAKLEPKFDAWQIG